MSTLYLHIGLPKTGTTFLQREVVPRIEGFQSLVVPKSNLLPREYPWTGVMQSILQCPPTVWDDIGEDVFRELFGTPGAVSGQAPKTLLSDEGMGGQRSRMVTHLHLPRIAALGRRWGFERVRVLVSVRRQDTVLGSSYAQMSDRIRGASQQHFERQVRKTLQETYEQWDYYRLYRALAEAVGQKNLLMLPYEMMLSDLPCFLKQWLAFLDVRDQAGHIIAQVQRDAGRKNVRSTGANTWTIRQPTMLGVRTIKLRGRRVLRRLGLPTEIALRRPDLRRSKTICLTPELSEFIMCRYQASNRQLAEALNIDLFRYGYYSSGTPSST